MLINIINPVKNHSEVWNLHSLSIFLNIPIPVIINFLTDTCIYIFICDKLIFNEVTMKGIYTLE